MTDTVEKLQTWRLPRLRRNTGLHAGDTLPALDKVLLFGLMLAAGGIATYLFVRNPNVGGSDGLDLLLPIHRFFRGEAYAHVLFPPGYGAVSYVVYLATGSIVLSGMLVSLLSYVFLIPLTYVVGRRLFGDRRVAILAAFAVTFNTYLMATSYLALSDSLFALVYLYGFALASRFVNPPKAIYPAAMLTGGILGVAYLIRPEAFLPALSCAVLGGAWGLWKVTRGSTDGLRILASSALLLGGFLLFAAPYVTYVRAMTGVWTPSPKVAVNLIIGEKVTEGGLEHVDQLQQSNPDLFQPGLSFVTYVQTQGWKFPLRVFTNAKRAVTELLSAFFFILIPSILVGAGALLRGYNQIRLTRPRKEDLAFLLPFAIFLVPLGSLTIFYIEDRYLVPYISIITLLAASIIVRFIDLIKGSFPRPLVSTNAALLSFMSVSLIVLVLPGSLPLLPATNLQNTLAGTYFQGVRSAGLWLRENHDETQPLKIMTPRKGKTVLFFAGDEKEIRGDFMDVAPNMSLGDVVATVTSGEVDYLVLYEPFVFSDSQLMPLWRQPEIAPSLGLSLLASDPGLFQIYGPASTK